MVLAGCAGQEVSLGSMGRLAPPPSETPMQVVAQGFAVPRAPRGGSPDPSPPGLTAVSFPEALLRQAGDYPGTAPWGWRPRLYPHLTQSPAPTPGYSSISDSSWRPSTQASVSPTSGEVVLAEMNC